MHFKSSNIENKDYFKENKQYLDLLNRRVCRNIKRYH